MILASVSAVMAESVEWIAVDYFETLRLAEWVFTGLFTVEYLLRLYCVGRPRRYATSFFGVVDLLALLPSYLSLLFAGAQYLLVIRLLRVLRVFRVLKLAAYISETTELSRAAGQPAENRGVHRLRADAGGDPGQPDVPDRGPGGGQRVHSIPRSIYWAIVTLTTVGYGDISPQTTLGQTVAAAIMLMGYAILAVPTGIVSAEMNRGHPSDPHPSDPQPEAPTGRRLLPRPPPIRRRTTANTAAESCSRPRRGRRRTCGINRLRSARPADPPPR